MSAVDVLAALDCEINNFDGDPGLLMQVRDAVAELIEADTAYDKASDDLTALAEGRVRGAWVALRAAHDAAEQRRAAALANCGGAK